MTNRNYIAVVTAKGISKRVARKNLLPLNGSSLVEQSIAHAKEAGLSVVVVTDSPEIKAIALTNGCEVVEEPNHSKGYVGTLAAHKAAIEAGAASHPDKHVVLLQPTSPFRIDSIISKCVAKHQEDVSSTVITGRAGHCMVDGKLEKVMNPVNGCVIIYPIGKVLDYSNTVVVRNSLLNEMEIDTEEDYEEACRLALTITEMPCPVAPTFLSSCLLALETAGVGDSTLVLRKTSNVSQDKPVVYVNTCQGYDGGRVDAVVIVANESMHAHTDPHIAECLTKAKVVIVRDHQYLKELYNRFPMIEAKATVIEGVGDLEVNTITTGSIAKAILNHLGTTDVVGGESITQYVSKLPYGSPHYHGGSFDVAIQTYN